MAAEVIRCSDCGTVFKGVPKWLSNAKVKFTCTNCPRRPTRGGARFEPAIEPRVTMRADEDDEVAVIPDIDDDEDMPVLDEDAELEDEKDV